VTNARRLLPTLKLLVAGLALIFGLESALHAAPRPRRLPMTRAPLEEPVAWKPRAGATSAEDGQGRIWMVDPDRDEVVPFWDGAVRAGLAAGAWPQQLVIDDDGTLYVSARQDGAVVAIDTSQQRQIVPVGAEPSALVLDAANRRLYVGLLNDREVALVDLRLKSVVARRAVDGTPDFIAPWRGSLVVLSRSNDRLQLFDPLLEPKGEATLPTRFSRRSAQQRGELLIPAGDELLAVYSDTLPSSQFGGVFGALGGGFPSGPGGATVPGYYVPADPRQVFVAGLVRSASGHPQALDLGVRLPVLDVSAGSYRDHTLFIASRTAGRVLSVAGQSVNVLFDAPGVSAVLTGSGGTLTALAAFERQVIHFDEKGSTTSPLAPRFTDPELALGERLFYTPVGPANRQLACSTCHPDGRSDGLTWSRGLENLQTPALADRLADTAPYHWRGTAPTLRASLTETFIGLGAKLPNRRRLKALERYLLEGLRPVSKPSTPHDAELVALGEEVFHRPEVGCAECHLDADGTDGAKHTVNAGAGQIDTPSLKQVALTAPYGHAGQAPTLEALLFIPMVEMGHVADLTAQERMALVEYLKTL
jgi:hypothetical protein